MKKIIESKNAVTWEFGGQKGLKFRASYFDNWVTIICYGGTGFAREAESEEQARFYVGFMDKMAEYEVIAHCNKRPDWKTYDYYSGKIYDTPSRMIVHHRNGTTQVIK